MFKLHLPYWKYDHFSLEDMNEDECQEEFRFLREDIYTLHDIMNIPEMFTCYNGVKVIGTEGVCILLKRYFYPNRYLDLILRFGRPVPQLCMIANHVMNFIYERWNHLVTSFKQPCLPPANLKRYADYIHQIGAPLENCGILWTGLCVLYVVLGKDKDNYVMNMNECTAKNFNRLYVPME